MAQVDLIIIIIYLFSMLGIGLYYRRFAGRGLENFFLAGREVPGWLNGVSYAAAMVSADSATAYGGLAVVTGVFVCWWYLSRFGLALFIGAVLFAFFWRRLGLFTSMEFYELRFSGNTAGLVRTWIAFRTSFIAMTAWTGITLLAAAKILGPTVGLSKTQTILLVVPVAFAYVSMSGYQGIVISNFIQMSIFLAGALCLAVLTLVHFGGPHGFAQLLVANLGPAGARMLDNFPPTDHPIFPLAAALAWLLGQTIGYGGDAAPMGGAMEGQRILSSRSPRHAVVMYVVTAVTMFTLVLLVSLPCMGAAILWPHLREVGADRELAYGLMMKRMLPAGAMGLVAAGMLAGVMSVVGDNLNFGSQVMLNDLYRRWIVRTASQRHYLLVGKICMLIILAMAIIVVYRSKFIFNVAVFMLQFSSAELPANWAQWWWWRFNGKARIASSFGGGAVFCLVVLGPQLLMRLGVRWAEVLLIPWWYQTFLVMGLTTILWVSVALLTKPDSQQVLVAFYRQAQPPGSWGPIRRLVAELDADQSVLETTGWSGIGRGFSIAVIGAVGVMSYILALSNFFIGSTKAGSLYLVSGLALILIFVYLLTSHLDTLEKQIK